MKNQNAMPKQLNKMEKRFRGKPVLLFVLIFSLLLLGSVIYRFIAQNNWLEKEFTHQVQSTELNSELAKLSLYIKVAESDGRGYAISCNRRFIENFDATIDSIRFIYQQAQQLENRKEERDNAALFVKFDRLIQKKIAFMQQVKKLCDNHDCKAALALIGTNEAFYLSDSILKINKQISKDIQPDLRKSQKGFARISSNNNKLAYTGIIASLSLIGLIFYLLLAEVRKTKKISEELFVRKENYRITLTSLGEGIISTDREGYIQYINPVAERLTGWSWQDAKNQPLHKVYNIVNEETGKPFEHIVNRILKAGKKIEWENNTLLKSKDSGTFIISNNGAPIFDLKGNITGAVLVFDDVTEKYRTAKQLRDSEEKYRNLVEQASDAILIYSFDGTIYEFNKACYTILGYTKEEFTKLKLTDILVEDIIVNQENYAAILAGETKTLYRDLMRKDGSLMETEVSVKTLADGKAIAFARDITERKMTEQRLKESEKNLRHVLSSASESFYVIDSRCYVTLINKIAGGNLEKAWGKPVTVGTNILELIPNENDEPTRSSLVKVFAGKEVEYELNLTVNDLASWTSVRYIPVRDENGAVVAAYITTRDITERKKAEETIKREKELSDSVINSLPGVFYFYDENLKMLRWNRQLENITGYSAEEIRSMNPAGFFEGEDRKYMQERSRKVFAAGSGDAEASFTTKAGKKIPFYFTGLRMQFEDRPCLLGIGIDITEHKNAEIKTKQAIERYDILARATSDTIWDWDIVNNRMLYNDGITIMFGYDASQVENVIDWWNEKLHPDDFQKVAESLENIFKAGVQRFQLTYRFRCADGTYKHIFDRAFVVFDDAGKPCRIIGAMQDITYEVQEEIRVGKVIIDAQELERRHIGEELHDNVNQILVGSLLNLTMAKESQGGLGRTAVFLETAKGYIGNAINEIRKLSHQLVPAILDDISIKDVFENLLYSINPDNRFTINLQVSDLNETVIPDDIKINLYRILQEQTKNILKYSEAGSIEVAVTSSGKTIVMKILDNGKGFDTTTSKNGIGLRNIKQRAESLSGKFLLKSAPGRGCEIIVEIPLMS